MLGLLASIQSCPCNYQQEMKNTQLLSKVLPKVTNSWMKACEVGTKKFTRKCLLELSVDTRGGTTASRE